MKALVLAASLAAAAPAAAQERPLLQPTKDVLVTYKLDGAASEVIPGGQPAGSLRLFWDATNQRMRLELDGRTQAMLVDLRARQAHVLDTGLRSYIVLPVGNAEMAAITLAGAQLTRRGSDMVAGLPCTNWGVQSPRGAGTICVTADGVALRAVGEVDGRRGAFTATDVLWGPQPAARFQVPAGYMSFAIPGMGRPR